MTVNTTTAENGSTVPVCVACVGNGTDPATGGPCLRCKGSRTDPDPGASVLTDRDRRTLAEARELAAVPASKIREFTGEDDGHLGRAVALARAQILLADLAAVVERLAAADVAPEAAEDTRRLAEVRGLLAAFDWEHDDRQYALEAIERIADGDDE